MVICSNEDCNKRAAFGTEYQKPLKCGLHKGQMKDVTRLRCKEKYCTTRPSFNYEGTTKGLYCSIHRLDKMINVIDKTCIFENCKIMPIYNYKDKSERLYCNTHKLENMVNIKHKTCIFEDCIIIPNYNFEGLKPLYCKTHCLKNMIDVVSKKCLVDNCNIIACYNYKGEIKRLYCNTHKLPNMINVVDKKCIYENCNIIPNYNYKGEKIAIYCKKHKLENMVDVKNKTCINKCGIIASKKYKGYCARCFASTFPNEPVTRNIKTKERSTIQFINETYLSHKWIFDKRVKEGTSMRRPDAFLDLVDYVIIIEIDENQHTYYDCSCSNKRLMELSIDVNHKPMVIIRFNPDSYYNSENIKIPSCWVINKETGLLTLNNENKWRERLICLKNHIDYWLVNKTDKLIEPIELFYDQNIV